MFTRGTALWVDYNPEVIVLKRGEAWTTRRRETGPQTALLQLSSLKGPLTPAIRDLPWKHHPLSGASFKIQMLLERVTMLEDSIVF